MSNRNPFEVRMDLLAMSKQYFDAIYDANLHAAQAVFGKALEDHQAKLGDWPKFEPKMYTFEEVIEKAKELYSFVNGK
jgi:hypothetical protein